CASSILPLVAFRFHTLIEICCKVGRLEISAVSLSGLSVAFIVVSFRVDFCFPFLNPLGMRSTTREQHNHQQSTNRLKFHFLAPLSLWRPHFDAVADVGFDEISRAALVAENFQPAIAVY